MPEKSGMGAALATRLLTPTAGGTSCSSATAPAPSRRLAAMAAIENRFFMMALHRPRVASTSCMRLCAGEPVHTFFHPDAHLLAQHCQARDRNLASMLP